MMLLMYRHGLRETELCRLTLSCLDLETARLWVERLKGSLSTHHPIEGDELRAIRRWLRLRASHLPWLFVTERGEQFTRQGIYYLVRRISERGGLEPGPSTHAAPRLRLRAGKQRTRPAHDPGLPWAPRPETHGHLHAHGRQAF
jgi:integrase